MGYRKVLAIVEIDIQNSFGADEVSEAIKHRLAYRGGCLPPVGEPIVHIYELNRMQDNQPDAAPCLHVDIAKVLENGQA